MNMARATRRSCSPRFPVLESFRYSFLTRFIGNADVCKLFLEAGVKTHRTNRIGKTASEMAGFCGQHHCVSVINNFLSRDDVESIMHPAGKCRFTSNSSSSYLSLLLKREMHFQARPIHLEYHSSCRQCYMIWCAPTTYILCTQCSTCTIIKNCSSIASNCFTLSRRYSSGK